jgi:hypothetical protein
MKTILAGLVAFVCMPCAAGQQVISIIVPSSARAAGANGAFYTTDLSIANIGTTSATFAVKFLGHDQDGTPGPSQTFSIPAGATVTFSDVLGTVFSQTSAYGAIQITSASQELVASAQTSTPGFGGTFGQSVPGFGEHSRLDTRFLTAGAVRAIPSVREDAAFRTNLVLANATGAAVDIDAALIGGDGARLGTKRYSLPPLGMTQISRVVRDFGVAGNVSGARLDLTVATPNGFVAAYAASIDNTTNDPRTLLPLSLHSASPFGHLWWIPSSARAQGANGSFYTTDLVVSNAGALDETFTLKFDGHDQPGGGTNPVSVTLPAGRTVTYADVLGSVFGQSSTYGAIEIFAAWTNATGGASNLVFMAQTSTPGFGGTFGQSVAAENSGDILLGGLHSILGVREDAFFRTNLILCNDISTVVPVTVSLVAAEGNLVGTKTYNVPPRGMTQITRVARDLGFSGDLAGARLVLSSSEIVAYASVIDNVTNDPRTLLPLFPYSQY